MKKRIIVSALMFVVIMQSSLAFSFFQGKSENINYGNDDILRLISLANNRTNAVPVFKSLGLSCAEIVASDNHFTIAVNQSFYLEDKDCSFKVKMSPKSFNNFMNESLSGDYNEAVKEGISSLSLWQKLTLFIKCRSSDICSKYLNV